MYKYCEFKRYVVEAKRKKLNERWTEWARTDDHEKALRHQRKAEQAGFDSRIVDRGGNK